MINHQVNVHRMKRGVRVFEDAYINLFAFNTENEDSIVGVWMSKASKRITQNTSPNLHCQLESIYFIFFRHKKIIVHALRMSLQINSVDLKYF